MESDRPDPASDPGVGDSTDRPSAYESCPSCFSLRSSLTAAITARHRLEEYVQHKADCKKMPAVIGMSINGDRRFYLFDEKADCTCGLTDRLSAAPPETEDK